MSLSSDAYPASTDCTPVRQMLTPLKWKVIFPNSGSVSGSSTELSLGICQFCVAPAEVTLVALLISCPVAVVPMTRASVETGLHPYNLCLVHDISVNTITQSEQMTSKSRGSNRLRSLHFEMILFLSKLSMALNKS